MGRLTVPLGDGGSPGTNAAPAVNGPMRDRAPGDGA